MFPLQLSNTLYIHIITCILITDNSLHKMYIPIYLSKCIRCISFYTPITIIMKSTKVQNPRRNKCSAVVELETSGRVPHTVPYRAKCHNYACALRPANLWAGLRNVVRDLG